MNSSIYKTKNVLETFDSISANLSRESKEGTVTNKTLFAQINNSEYRDKGDFPAHVR